MNIRPFLVQKLATAKGPLGPTSAKIVVGLFSVGTRKKKRLEDRVVFPLTVALEADSRPLLGYEPFSYIALR